MTAPAPTPLGRALKELPEWTIEASAPFNDLLAQLGAALLRQDARLAEVERERDEWQDAANDYHSLAVRFQASQARVAKLRAALEAARKLTLGEQRYRTGDDTVLLMRAEWCQFMDAMYAADTETETAPKTLNAEAVGALVSSTVLAGTGMGVRAMELSAALAAVVATTFEQSPGQHWIAEGKGKEFSAAITTARRALADTAAPETP